MQGADLAPELSRPGERPLSRLPGFGVPAVDGKGSDYDAIADHIRRSMPGDVPALYGMHANSELGFLTNAGNTMIDVLRLVEGGSSSGVSNRDRGAGVGGESTVRTVLEELLSRLPAEFGMVDMATRAQPLQRSANAPFVALVLQVTYILSWYVFVPICVSCCRNARA